MSRPALPLFPGWFVVAGAFAVTFVGFGGAYTFSAFFEPLRQTFGATRGSVSLVFSIAGFLYFSLGVISGPLADRFGTRRVAAAGMILLGVGLALAGLARSLIEVYLAYGLGVGIGVGLAYVPALGAVQRWFDRRRGLASGLAVSGIGVGTLALPPLAALLVEQVGWRATYLLLGAACGLIGLGAALLLRNDPAGLGYAPDGLPALASAPPPGGLTVSEAVRTRRFAGLYLACLICAFGVFTPFVHLVPYAMDHGVPAARAALLLGAIGVGSTAGRFLLGGLADRLGRETTLLAMVGGVAASLAAWALLDGFWPLMLFAAAFGVFYGGWVALLPALVMDAFGGRSVGGIIGLLYTSVALGTLVGPPAAGWMFDATGGYRPAILAAAATSLVGLIVLAATFRRRN
ncbi:MFS transporter [Caulobacter mirabilis]|uniref:MFS transporter n=1 Tax=Caulobacter mirabilis TaxID=69666 RepID=A0A2D2AX06_9CAUL|nr:MFS transporter [Caulobacter mirabilis]ATQ42523.1 MFS transporter [Caulobacter mirabilis]